MMVCVCVRERKSVCKYPNVCLCPCTHELSVKHTHVIGAHHVIDMCTHKHTHGCFKFFAFFVFIFTTSSSPSSSAPLSVSAVYNNLGNFTLLLIFSSLISFHPHLSLSILSFIVPSPITPYRSVLSSTVDKSEKTSGGVLSSSSNNDENNSSPGSGNTGKFTFMHLEQSLL